MKNKSKPQPPYTPLHAARKPHDPKRYQEIHALRAGGAALKTIARRYKISISRVHSILHPEMLRANLVVRDRIRKGIMIRPNQCEDCPATVKIWAHHDDYNKPEEVRWLCRKCHAVADRKRRDTLPPTKRFSVVE